MLSKKKKLKIIINFLIAETIAKYKDFVVEHFFIYETQGK